MFGCVQTPGTKGVHDHIYALRYEVYCLECGFLRPEDYTDGLESDEYDAWSAHFTAHDLTNELVGSVRLVRPPPDEPFPFEHHCKNLFRDFRRPPAQLCGEVSRLVVRRSFRRRLGDSLEGVSSEFLLGTYPPPSSREMRPDRRSHSPEILLGLYREMYRHSVRHGVRYWYAAMERSLARALGRLEFVFTPIGETTDYYGPVTPYIADLRELEERLAERNSQLLDWFRNGR